MTDPESLLVAGDLHGNPRHGLYLFQTALDQHCDVIFQVGDFGYWEHEEGGAEFLDMMGEVATDNDLPVFFIDGNHENHELLRAKYGDEQTSEGFWIIRKGLYYVPRGTRWEWSGVKMMGFGGAISIDRDIRLKRESEPWMDGSGRVREPTGFRTQWWPEEDVTDAELEAALADREPLDILFTHDKPRASNPLWNRKDVPMLWPVQDRIQTLVHELTPKLLIHGHLHWRYTDLIRAGKDGRNCRVEGLNCDDTGRESWEALRLT